MSTFTDLEIETITKTLSPTQKSSFDTQYQATKKSRGIALVLSIIPFVGHAGAGRFYLGQTGLGILHIVLCLMLGIPGVIYWIVDWFLIGKACDQWNREKAREIATQVKALG